MSGPRNVKVYIANSNDVLAILTACETSVEMMAISCSYFLALLPDIQRFHPLDGSKPQTLRNPLLAGWGSATPIPISIADIEFDSYDSNQHWSSACGKSCPALRRRIRHLALLRLFQWNIEREDALLQCLNDSSLTWQMAKTCQNNDCDHANRSKWIAEDRWFDP